MEERRKMSQPDTQSESNLFDESQIPEQKKPASRRAATLDPEVDTVLKADQGDAGVDMTELVSSGSSVLNNQDKSRAKGKGMAVSRHYTKQGVQSLRHGVGRSESNERAILFKETVKFREVVGIGASVNAAELSRVADTIADWGIKDGYFAGVKDAEVFRAELTHLLVNQLAAFNSPVWFNVGVEKKPQCSACFINSVDDTMESILDLAKTEGMLFKFGSGAGSNLSAIRSAARASERRRQASGPVSFMKGFDAFAGVIKSGGKTRRAAKMVILNADHPDIEEFIDCKVNEEKKAWALIDAGYDGSFNGEAYGVGLLPERQQLRARHRRVHARGGWRTATGPPAR